MSGLFLIELSMRGLAKFPRCVHRNVLIIFQRPVHHIICLLTNCFVPKFNNLRNSEKISGFEESVYSEKGKKLNFFNLGFQNRWQKKLPGDIVQKVNMNLNKELIELGYSLK